MADSNIVNRQVYQDIRDTFKQRAMNWNGVWKVWTNQSPDWGGRWVYGWKGVKIKMYDTIPESVRDKIQKEYTGLSGEVNQVINEESSKIHTLGNENNIRRAVIQLNNTTDANIGVYIGSEKLPKIEVKTIGTAGNFNPDVNIANTSDDYTVNKYNTSYVRDIPANKIVNTTTGQEVPLNAVITKDINQKTQMEGSTNPTESSQAEGIVKKSDYELIRSVLERIKDCLIQKNSWFTYNGICSRSCQINCQNRCQVSCQGCNTKQCHDQNCGSI